jgi:cytochrome c oxidase assembly protein subunit 15
VRLVQRLALSTLVLQMVLVVSGAAVRVTGSGLGCPTWPRCTGGSLTNTGALGAHGLIEFGNRTLAVVVEAVAVLLVVAVRRHAPQHFRLALVQAAVVPLQAVIGGLLVLSGLNPYVLILHFLTSFPLIWAALLLVRRLVPGGSDQPLVHSLAGGIVAAAGLVLVLGSLVTGTGPHAGDPKVHRLPFDPREITQLHADGVFLLVGLTLAALFVAWSGPLRPWVLGLAGLLVAQAGLGYWQYFHGVPAFAVGLHVAGATVIFALAGWLFLSTRATRSDPADATT